jgi:enhancing lycopene biosynthesis protein 2
VTRFELVGTERLARNRNVLLLAARIGESKVDELDLLVLERLENIGGCSSHAFLLLVRGNECENGRKTSAADAFFAEQRKAETMP